MLTSSFPVLKTTNSSDQTMQLGFLLAKQMEKGRKIICFFGDLGSGKTTFIKGLAKGLGIDSDTVFSPTFVLMNCYQGQRTLVHFDLYRLNGLEEFLAKGLEEHLYEEGIICIEWPERIKSLIAGKYIGVHIRHKSEDQREIVIREEG